MSRCPKCFHINSRPITGHSMGEEVAANERIVSDMIPALMESAENLETILHNIIDIVGGFRRYQLHKCEKCHTASSCQKYEDIKRLLYGKQPE